MSQQPERQLLSFRAAGQRFAIAVDRVPEVFHIPALVRAPGQPPVLAGFINLRGRVLPVAYLSKLLDAGAAELGGLYAPVLVLDHRLGLVVEAVDEVISVAEPQIETVAPARSFNGCACGQIATPSGLLTVLEPDRLLLEEEWRCAAELAEQTQARLAMLEGRGQ